MLVRYGKVKIFKIFFQIAFCAEMAQKNPILAFSYLLTGKKFQKYNIIKCRKCKIEEDVEKWRDILAEQF